MSQQPAGQNCANCYFGVPDSQGLSCRVNAPEDPYSGHQLPLPRLYVTPDYWCGKYSTTAVPGSVGHAGPGATTRAGGAPSGQNCSLCYFGIQDNQGIACRVEAPAPSLQGNQISAQRRYVSPDFWCGLFSTTPSSGENPPGVTSFNARTGDVNLLASDVTAVGGLANPNVSLTGVPTATTASPGTNSQQIATTAFVANAVASGTAGVASFNGRTGIVTLQTSDVTGAGGLTQNQTITLSGDLVGAGATAIPSTVTGLQGRAVASTAPSSGQVLQWSGTSWTPGTPAAAGVSSITAGAGLTGGTITTTGTIALSSPVAIANGGTNATTASAALANLGGISGNQTITLSGDISGSGATSIATTLPIVNSNVGTFQGITVNAKGLVTAAVAQNYLTANQTVTLSGDVTGSGATAIAATVARLQGQPVSATAPTSGQVLQWSGTQWAPTTPAAPGTGTVTSITAGAGLTGGTITTSGTIALASPITTPLQGVTDGSNAAAGQVGEYQSATAAPGTVSAATWTVVGSLTLAAGDWDVWAVASFTSTPPGMGGVNAGLGTNTTGAPNLGQYSTIGMGAPSLWANFNWGAALWTTTAMTLATVNLSVGQVRLSSNAATTFNLLVNVNVSSGITASAGGSIFARRMR